MPQLLICIPTCDIYEGNPNSPNRNEAERRTACRETWLNNCPVDYKFFYGSGHVPTADEVTLEVADGYDNLSNKFRAICKWTLDNGYDFLFRVDTDAYVYTDRLLKSGFETHDYSGYTIDYPGHLAHARYASGAGWTMSRKAMQIVADVEPDNQADDLWTGTILFRHGIRCHRDTRYVCGFEPHFVPLTFLPPIHPAIVLHALRPEEIRKVHALPYPGDDITPQPKSIFEPTFDFKYGRKSRDCGCTHCR